MTNKEDNEATSESLSPELIKLAYDIGMRSIRTSENGIASLSGHIFPWPLPQGADREASASKGLKLEWQDAVELQAANGFISCAVVLNGAEYGGLGRKPIEKIKADILRLLGKDGFAHFEAVAPPIGATDKGPNLHAIFFRATWVQFFAEKLSIDWLAAMAEHAYFVKNDEFAFGYMTALLDQKRGKERFFMSGAKSSAGASDAGKARSAKYKAQRAMVIREMLPLVKEHGNISLAAEIAAKRGIGKSKNANRKLWYEYGPRNL
ncbi:hypothetical protein [Hoeflea sp.]|uniref:hypothetical protein n=1 Tax=Hoeflea sp. TaxID=1940281 RepID=UPI003A918C1E